MQGDLPSAEGRLAPSPLSIRLPSCDSEEHISRSAIAMPSASTSADEPVILYSPYFFTNLTGKNLPLSSSSMAFIIFMSFRKIPLLDTEAEASPASGVQEGLSAPAAVGRLLKYMAPAGASRSPSGAIFLRKPQSSGQAHRDSR